MRILIVSYAFPPATSARAIRWGEIARHWQATGHRVTVVAAGLPGVPARETWRGVDVVRVGRGLRERIRGAAHGGGVASAIGWLYRQTWRRVCWPDAAALWVPLARAAVTRAIAAADALVTVSPPFSGHLAGLGLARPAGARWLADFGDPFSFLAEHPANNFRLYGHLNRRAERAILERADAVTFTHEGTHALYAALAPRCASRLHVIPPLLPEGEERAIAVALPRSALNLVYVGRFYAGVREPDALLAVIAHLLESNPEWRDVARLHLFGPDDGVLQEFPALAGRSVILHGPADRATAAAAIRAADVLVNVGNMTPHQLPSKLVEYAASGRPIVNVATREDDTSARFLAGYPLLLNLCPPREGMDGAVARLSAFLAEHGRERLDAAAAAAFVAPFRARAVAERYLALLGDRSSVTSASDHAA